MKLSLCSKEMIGNVMSKTEDVIIPLIFKTLGLAASFFARRNKEGNTFISPDGHYALSWSGNGLIYLILLGLPPSVVSFHIDSDSGIWSAVFSKDMQRIIITYNDGAKTTLSAVPGADFHRRQVPIAEPFWSYEKPFPTCNIVEFICQTSSAYWKHINNQDAKRPPKWTTPFQLPHQPPPDSNCNWEQWVSQGERFLDSPRGRVASWLG